MLTAGYCLYSSSTIFVLTTGDGVYGFTLDPLVGEFIMSHENVKVATKLDQVHCQMYLCAFNISHEMLR